MKLPKNYDYKESEIKWVKKWEKDKTYKFNPNSKKQIYSIDTPPPTMSGKMHIGHAFGFSQMDFVARYKRMRNFELFYPFGTDDNGLATEKLVEKEKKVNSKKMDREDFIKLCLDFIKNYREDFIYDWKRIGVSSDYNLNYSTIEKEPRKISQNSFIELYNKNRAYRKDAPTLWCPKCQTGIAQIDMEDKEVPSYFNDIIFKSDKDLIIATTRPELLPACVALFYNPKDKRYKHLKNKKAKTPLFNQEVPILEDQAVDMEKGTGLMMCCTFGDQDDIEKWAKHKLPMKIIFTKDGKLNEQAGKYKGLKIEEARKQIIKDLKQNNLLKSQKQITHTVNIHERCGTPVEILKSKQWFIKYLDLKKDMISWGKKLNWHPKHMFVRYENWIKGLQWDWCISRQRHFGIPFPLWYCKDCGEVILADESQLPIDPLKDKPKTKCKCGSKNFIPETDVIDTWATSSLTPQLAINLVKNKEKLFPMNLRPQGHDIITFWLFNTVVKSNLHYKKNPWKDVTINGFVLDPKRKKMSKSKGNVIDPRDVLKTYPADAMRFWAASSKLGDDLPYQEKDLQTGNKTITKLWNSFKFLLIHLENYKPKKTKLEPIDQWLLSKLNNTVTNYINYFDNYDHSHAKTEIESFFWNIFCDNYLEIVKHRLYNEKQGTESAKYTLYVAFLTQLKLFAPIMPFITEEIYSLHFNKIEKEESIHTSEIKDLKIKTDEKAGDRFISILQQVRKFKSEKSMSMKEKIKLEIPYKKLKPMQEDLKEVCNAELTFKNKFKISI